MTNDSLNKISYGLYVLTANENKRDNGCIIDTVMQASSNPENIAISVNNEHLTCLMINNTKKFNISILDIDTPINLIKHFGYQSGKNINKFEKFSDFYRLENGITYINQNVNSYICCEVSQKINLGSHTLFIARITDSKVLSNKKSLTYEYYQESIKNSHVNQKGWRCKICGYIYKKEILPNDYICPVCKHGAIYFEKIV